MSSNSDLDNLIRRASLIGTDAKDPEAKFRQALADFIEGEVVKILGEKWTEEQVKHSDDEEIHERPLHHQQAMQAENHLRAEQRLRLQELLKGLRK